MSLLPYMKVKYRVFETISDSDMENFYVFRKLLLGKLNSIVKITYLDTDGKVVVNNVYRMGKIFIRDLVWKLEIISEKREDIEEFRYVKEEIAEETKKLFKHCASISIFSPFISRKYRMMAAEIVLRKMGFLKVENFVIQSSNGPEKVSFTRGDIAAKICQNSIEIFSMDLSVRDTLVEEFRKTCREIFGFDIFNRNLNVHRENAEVIRILKRVSKGYGKIAIVCNSGSYVLYVSGSLKPILESLKKISTNTMFKIVFDVKKCGYRLYGVIYVKNFFHVRKQENIKKIRKKLEGKIIRLYSVI